MQIRQDSILSNITYFLTERRRDGETERENCLLSVSPPLRLSVKKNFFNNFLILLIVFWFGLGMDLKAEESYRTIPVAYKGRYVPLEVYAKHELQELYGKQQIKKEHLKQFNLTDRSALTFFLKFYFDGHEQFDSSPLFSIHYAELKKILGLNLKSMHFSYNELKSSIFENEETNLGLMRLLIPYFYEKNKAKTQEIKQLAQGLFVTLEGGVLTVSKAPNTPPWNFLNLSSQFEYDENVAKSKLIVEEALNLLTKMKRYKSWNGANGFKDLGFQKTFQEMQGAGVAQKEMAVLLETEHPTFKRLQEAGDLFKALPLKRSGGFVSLQALNLKTYDSKTGSLQDVGNFTAYSDKDYEAIRKAYFEKDINVLGNALNDAYISLAGTPSIQAFQKATFYPTKLQLKGELFYYHYPFIQLTIVLYALALIGLIFGETLKNVKLTRLSMAFVGGAFILHTFVLGLRCFILNRPPVSNMFETVIYVPWIAMIAGFIFYIRHQNTILLMASSISALSLLILLEITGMNNSLENVQAVLDSQYWLIVHVLLIVGSYGVFFLSGILGQMYLIHYFFKEKETPETVFLAKFVLQTMYLGVFMLIPGTILGGVWAAESWGRFWDWDPKESWAFISSCIYLIFIHAYRFRKIGSFGLSVGSIVGLMAISFTWYGVNYILGTGLHSYGFGSGGEIYYYIFLITELIFLIIVSYKHKNIVELKSKNVV